MAVTVAALTIGMVWAARDRWSSLYSNRLTVNEQMIKSVWSYLKPGVTRYYQVELASTAFMRKGAESSKANDGQPDIEVKLTGRLALEWDAASPGDVIRLRFEPSPSLNLRQVNESNDFPPESATISSLIIGIPFRMNARGQLTYAEASMSGDRFAIQLLRQIAAVMQVCMPEDQSQKSWDCDEQDGSGIYHAHYETVTQSAPLSLTRVKSGYALLQAMNDGVSPPPLKGTLSGEGSIELGTDHSMPQTVSGHEEALVTIIVDGGEIQSNARTTYSIRVDGELVESYNAATSQPSQSPGASESPPAQKVVINDSGDSLKRAAQERFGNVVAHDILKEFEGVRNSDSPSRAQAARDVYDKLVGYVRTHDTELGDILKTLSGRAADDPWLREVLSALAYVGCKECQRHLVNEVMARESEPAFASDLLSLLAQPAQPSADVEAALRRLTESPQPVIHDMAELALGTVGYKLRDSDQPRSTAIYQQYADKFRQAQDVNAQMAALSVLGNIGDEGVVDALKPWVVSSDHIRREAAARALRNLRSDGARQMLISMLADDAVSVRRAAVQSIAQMPKSDNALKALSDRFASEKSALVRQPMVQDLARYLRDTPKAQEVVKAAANSDADPDVRLTATNALIMYGIP